MSDLVLLQRVGLAAVIGLLIGIERGWQTRQTHDGMRVAGIRTFTLIGSLGGICGLLPGDITLGLCFAGFSFPFGWFEWRKSQRSSNYSATDFIAGVLTFALGAYAVRGAMPVAAAAGVVVAAILAERRLLHAFVLKLKWTELRAALALLVMTLVLLPALPDHVVDPWGAINPYQIWVMTVLVGAVSYAGYIAVRVGGERRGLLFAGIMGGLVTSTTVTWTFARLARKSDRMWPEVEAAILSAWIVSLLRMTALAAAFAPALLIPLLPPIVAASMVLLIPAALAYRSASRVGPQTLAIKDPFELPLMLRFCALLVAIMLLAKLLSSKGGGLSALSGASGIIDVDPITMSMARMAGNAVPLGAAALTILVAAITNGISKAILVGVFGGLRRGVLLSAYALLALGAGTLTFVMLN